MAKRNGDPRDWPADRHTDGLPLFSGSPATPEPPRPAAVMDRPTSVAAAESVRSSAAQLRERVLEHIRAAGSAGATCDEVEAALQLRHQTASARVNELMKAGQIYEGGKRATRSGRQAIAWRAR